MKKLLLITLLVLSTSAMAATTTSPLPAPTLQWSSTFLTTGDGPGHGWTDGTYVYTGIIDRGPAWVDDLGNLVAWNNDLGSSGGNAAVYFDTGTDQQVFTTLDAGSTDSVGMYRYDPNTIVGGKPAAIGWARIWSRYWKDDPNGGNGSWEPVARAAQKIVPYGITTDGSYLYVNDANSVPYGTAQYYGHLIGKISPGDSGDITTNTGDEVLVAASTTRWEGLNYWDGNLYVGDQVALGDAGTGHVYRIATAGFGSTDLGAVAESDIVEAERIGDYLFVLSKNGAYDVGVYRFNLDGSIDAASRQQIAVDGRGIAVKSDVLGNPTDLWVLQYGGGGNSVANYYHIQDAIPEPATLAVLALGGLAGLLKRRA